MVCTSQLAAIGSKPSLDLHSEGATQPMVRPFRRCEIVHVYMVDNTSCDFFLQLQLSSLFHDQQEQTLGSSQSQPYLIFFKTYESFQSPDQPFNQSYFPSNSVLSTNHQFQPLNLSYSEHLTDSTMMIFSQHQTYMIFSTT